MKKIMTHTIIFILISAITMATASAAVVITAQQEMAVRYAMEQEMSQAKYWDFWTLESRISLIEKMIEANLAFPIELTTKFQSETDIIHKSKIADELITALLGRTDAMGHNALLQFILNGQFDTWDYETKAWYYDLAVEYHLPIINHVKYVLPKEDDMQYNEAVEKSKDILISKFNIDEAEINKLVIYAFFGTYYETNDDLVWFLEFHNPDNTSEFFLVLLSRYGELVASRHPGQGLQFENAIMTYEIRDAIPGEHDATEEEALKAAKNALEKIYGYSQQEINHLTYTSRFHYSPEFCHGDEPVWLITFTNSQTGEILHKVLLAYDASLIESIRGAEFFRYPYHIIEPLGTLDDLMNEEGVYYLYWSVEEKAAFSKKWRPLAEQYRRDNPYYIGKGNPFIDFTQRIYGVPSENDISQDDALIIAQQAIKDLGVSEAIIQRLSTHQLYFDITIENEPQWRMMIHRPVDDEPRQEGDNFRFWVKIDARNGDVLHVARKDAYNDDFLLWP